MVGKQLNTIHVTWREISTAVVTPGDHFTILIMIAVFRLQYCYNYCDSITQEKQSQTVIYRCRHCVDSIQLTYKYLMFNTFICISDIFL